MTEFNDYRGIQVEELKNGPSGGGSSGASGTYAFAMGASSTFAGAAGGHVRYVNVSNIGTVDVWFHMYDSATPPVSGDPITQPSVAIGANGGVGGVAYGGAGRSFTNALQWAASSTAATYTPAPTAVLAVEAEIA